VRGPGDLAVERRPAPRRRGPGDVLVQVLFGGICGTDLSYWRHGRAGRSVVRQSMVLGHEVSGTILEASDDGASPEAGTAVAIHPVVSPLHWSGRGPLRNVDPEASYLGSAARDPHTDGAFCDVVRVHRRTLRLLPEGVEVRDGALAEPASVAWRAVDRAGQVSGRSVLVVGAGPIGCLVATLCRSRGAREVTVVDTAEQPLAIAREMGATSTSLAADVGTGSTGAPMTTRDVVLECSGSAAGLRTAIRSTGISGVLVLVGLQAPEPQPVAIMEIMSREITVVPSFRFDGEMGPVLEAMAGGTLDVGPLVRAEYPADEAPAAFDRAANAGGGKVMLTFGQ
ncbi:MAG: zinc-binding dehydrogenase, partial [Actinomycetaceae bacterium]